MKTIVLLFVSLMLVSCIDCESENKYMKEDECILIVEEIPSYRKVYFDYKGRDLHNRSCECTGRESYRWWNQYKKYIEVGDTIIKRKEELIFSIHKKDTILSFEFVCK